MVGTRAGGIKGAQTTKERYGDDFFKKIGREGGLISRGGGFASSHELAVRAGRKGGKAPKRRRVVEKVEPKKSKWNPLWIFHRK